MPVIPGAALPPYEAVMPAVWQSALTWTGAVLTLATLLWAIQISRNGKNWIPLASWFGGLAAVLLEAFSDVLALAWHPVNGQWSAFTLLGRPIPWHIVLFYGPYYFGPAAVVIGWMRKSQLDGRRYWAMCLGMMATALVWEIFPIGAGVWMYYGPQPLSFFGMPVWFVSVNACCLMTAALVAGRLERDGEGLLAIVAALIAPPVLQAAVTAGVGWPTATALNSAAPTWVIWASSFATLALAFATARFSLSLAMRKEST